MKLTAHTYFKDESKKCDPKSLALKKKQGSYEQIDRLKLWQFGRNTSKDKVPWNLRFGVGFISVGKRLVISDAARCISGGLQTEGGCDPMEARYSA